MDKNNTHLTWGSLTTVLHCNASTESAAREPVEGRQQALQLTSMQLNNQDIMGH